jgi:hypothetical protein
MMGGVSLEICWASHKCEIIKFWYIFAYCWIFLFEFYLQIFSNLLGMLDRSIKLASSRMRKLHLPSSTKLKGEVLKTEHYRWMGSIYTSFYVGPGFKPCFGKELSQDFCCVAVYPGRCRDIIYNAITADLLIPLSRSIKTAYVYVRSCWKHRKNL